MWRVFGYIIKNQATGYAKNISPHLTFFCTKNLHFIALEKHTNEPFAMTMKIGMGARRG